MADRAPAPKRVAVITADGQFGTVEEHEAGLIEQSGGRVLTKAQALQAQQREEYDAKGAGEKLVGGAVATATGPIVGNALAGTGVIADSPEAQAFSQGMSSAATGGLDQVAVKKALEFTAGKAAADAYGKHQLEIAKANEGYKTAGEVTGFAAMALGGGGKGLSRALPGGAISAIGAGAEQAASSALGGLASRGVLGRALATGGELAARGATEGALYSTANEYTEEMLGDTGLNGDKLFAAFGHGALMGGAGGAALGATGSLAKSAVGGVVGAARGGLSRVMGRAEQAAADAGAKADTAIAEGKALAQDATQAARDAATQRAAAAAEDAAKAARGAAKEVAEFTGTKPAQEAGTVQRALNDWSTRDGQLGKAYDLAFDAIGRGNGLQSTRFTAKAQRYLRPGEGGPGGTREVGKVLFDDGIISANDGVVSAMRNGTATDMLPKIEAARAANSAKIADMTNASPARIAAQDIDAAVERIASEYDTKLGQRHVAASVRGMGDELMEILGLAKRDPATGKLVRTGGDASIQDVLAQRKSLDEVIYGDIKALDPNRRVGALRDLRGEIEGLVVDSLDKAGGGLQGEAAAAYNALKRKHVALSIAEDLATDSAVREAKQATLGLRDMLFGGGGLKGAALGFGHKVIRERGSAGAAVLMHRMADLGTLSKAINSVNESIGRAAKGITVAPRKGALPERPPVDFRARAAEAMRRVSEAQADPATYVDKVTRNTEAMGTTAPMLAGALTQKATDYLAFMAAKMPSAPPANPLDPHPMPVLTDQQARKVALYDWYWERPGRFFDELEHGKMTFEGLEVAKAAMPGAFQELQMRTAEGLATLASLGKKPPYQQRQNLGALLDFPATASQRPEHAAFLQKNAASMVDANKPPPAPKGSTKHATQRSALDRLESDGVGRR